MHGHAQFRFKVESKYACNNVIYVKEGKRRGTYVIKRVKRVLSKAQREQKNDLPHVFVLSNY